jgi:hypothetical protein
MNRENMDMETYVERVYDPENVRGNQLMHYAYSLQINFRPKKDVSNHSIEKEIATTGESSPSGEINQTTTQLEEDSKESTFRAQRPLL